MTEQNRRLTLRQFHRDPLSISFTLMVTSNSKSIRNLMVKAVWFSGGANLRHSFPSYTQKAPASEAECYSRLLRHSDRQLGLYWITLIEASVT